jgi:c-di-GMP-binding flagellar brake protein YcgR
MRFGFPAQLIGLMSDYTMSAGHTVEALLAKKTGDAEPTDFRMYFRVKPPSNTDLCLFMEDHKVSLLDISIGGAKFIFPKRHFFRPGGVIQVKLLIGLNSFNVEALVRNVHEADIDANNKNLQYVSVRFHYTDKDTETSLGKAIMEIERSLLSEGKM